MPHHATKQKLQSWLTCHMLCCCTYIGLAADQLANLPQVSLQLFVNSCIVILVAIATTLEVAVFPVFHCRWCICRCGIAVVWCTRGALHYHPTPPLPCGWAVDSVPVFATCPCKNKDNHAKHDIVRKLPRMSIPATIGGLTSRCRSHPPKTKTVTRIVAPTSPIPVTVVADSPGKGGQGGIPWGLGGGSSPGPESIYIYICIYIYVYIYMYIYTYMCVLSGCVCVRVLLQHAAKQKPLSRRVLCMLYVRIDFLPTLPGG